METLAAILRSTVTAFLLTALASFFTLHSLQNLFAELLTFADREFYKVGYSWNEEFDCCNELEVNELVLLI